MVCDDFELTCWDFVTRPSTPSAFIKTAEEELQPFIEDTNKKSDKNKLINEGEEKKYGKFLDWLEKK